MKILMGTKNPGKIEGAKQAFEKYSPIRAKILHFKEKGQIKSMCCLWQP